jgi:hypothetical protein
MSAPIIRLTCVSAIACTIALMMGPSALARGGGNPDDASAVQLFLPYTSVNGAIRNTGDVNFYKFDAIAGREVTILLRTESIGSDLNAILSFYDGSWKLLAYNDHEWNLGSGQFGQDPILYLKIPSTGTYYLAVSSAAQFRRRFLPGMSGTTGSYDLTLFTRFDSWTVQDQYEPNDTLQAATAISLPFESIGANLLYLGDMDWYTFNANKGDRISIDIDALEMQCQPGWGPVVRTRLGLFDAKGQSLLSVDKGSDPDDGFADDPALIFDVPQNGKYYIAVTTQPDTQFATLFNNPTFLQDPYVSGLENRIGFYRLQVRVLNQLYFPHIANGAFGDSSFSTSIVLLNCSSQTATGGISFFKSDGTSLKVSLTSDSNLNDTHWFSVPPWGGLLLKTDGTGQGASGYAIVTSTAPIGGNAILSQYDSQGALMTEAGVGNSTPMDFFVIPVDLTGSYNAGLAVANIAGASISNLYLRLVNYAGQCVATRSLSLEPGKQTSVFVSGPDQLFPGLADFRGSLQVLADTPVYVVALRSGANTLTTLTPAPLNLSFNPISFTFPHVVVGSASALYRSTVVLTNPGYFPVNGTIQFTRSDGNPMVVAIGSNHSSQYSYTIPAQGTAFLEASTSSDFQMGFAAVTANHGVAGTLIISQYDPSSGRLQTEVAIPPAQFFRDFIVFAQGDASYNTGIAFTNTSAEASAMQYLLRSSVDPSTTSELGPVSLDPSRHEAILISGSQQLFPGFAGYGSLEVTSSQPISAVALRITATTMTVLPIIPLSK